MFHFHNFPTYAPYESHTSGALTLFSLVLIKKNLRPKIIRIGRDCLCLFWQKGVSLTGAYPGNFFGGPNLLQLTEMSKLTVRFNSPFFWEGGGGVDPKTPPEYASDLQPEARKV